MKNFRSSFLMLLISTCLLISCAKYVSEPQFNQKEKDAWNWCAGNIVAWGDSYTEGPGAQPYPAQLAQLTGQTVLNMGVSGQVASQIYERFEQDTALYKSPTIIWMGNNNNWDTAQTNKFIAATVGKLNHNKYLIIGVMPMDVEVSWKGDSSEVWKGMLNYYIVQENQVLAKKYPGHFIDLLPLLQAHAEKNAVDSLCVVHNVTPESLRVDILHLNTKGYGILAKEIASKLDKCNIGIGGASFIRYDKH